MPTIQVRWVKTDRLPADSPFVRNAVPCGNMLAIDSPSFGNDPEKQLYWADGAIGYLADKYQIKAIPYLQGKPLPWSGHPHSMRVPERCADLVSAIAKAMNFACLRCDPADGWVKFCWGNFPSDYGTYIYPFLLACFHAGAYYEVSPSRKKPSLNMQLTYPEYRGTIKDYFKMDDDALDAVFECVQSTCEEQWQDDPTEGGVQKMISCMDSYFKTMKAARAEAKRGF